MLGDELCSFLNARLASNIEIEAYQCAAAPLLLGLVFELRAALKIARICVRKCGRSDLNAEAAGKNRHSALCTFQRDAMSKARVAAFKVISKI